MIKTFIRKISKNPRIFVFLRRILENNYPAQRKIFSKEFVTSAGEKILDIGCGTGDHSIFFQNADYVGIDIEEKYIDYAQKKYKGEFLVGDATSLHFSDNVFDKIIIVAVLHHLNDADAKLVLKETKRVLKPGGRMLVMEDIQSEENGFLTRLVHRLDKGENIRRPEEYKALIQKNFAIEKDFQVQSGLCPYQVFVFKLL